MNLASSLATDLVRFQIIYVPSYSILSFNDPTVASTQPSYSLPFNPTNSCTHLILPVLPCPSIPDPILAYLSFFYFHPNMSPTYIVCDNFQTSLIKKREKSFKFCVQKPCNFSLLTNQYKVSVTHISART